MIFFFFKNNVKGIANPIHLCVTHQHQDRGSLYMAQWVAQSGSLEAADRHKVNNIHPSHSSTNLAHCSVLSSRVVVVGGRVVVVCLSFFFPFLSVLGFLVALGSLFFFLSFFFFLPSSGALLTLPNKPGRRRNRGEERGFYITRIRIHA